MATKDKERTAGPTIRRGSANPGYAPLTGYPCMGGLLVPVRTHVSWLSDRARRAPPHRRPESDWGPAGGPDRGPAATRTRPRSRAWWGRRGSVSAAAPHAPTARP